MSATRDSHAILVHLEAAIAQLPDKQRQVFIMRYYDELKYEEMEQILGTSIGALKASYHHAVKKIATYLRKI
jgi:RNA polymerase sigma-70 factor, ECF subfamily